MDSQFSKEHRGYYHFTFGLSFIIVLITSSFFLQDSLNLTHFILTSMNWFFFFFLVPLWLSGWIVFALRRRSIHHTALEFGLIWIIFLFGSLLKEAVNSVYLLTPSSSFYELISLTFFWAAIFYAIERAYYSGKLLLSSKIKTIKAEADARRYQLNPHMLFNSLNTISSLIYTDPQKADMVLHKLAELLRYSLDVSSNKFVTLSVEIDVVKKYLEIEQARFEDKLDVSFAIEQDCLNLLLPPLILQSLVENAIKHNSFSNGLLIDVRVYNKGHRVSIEVADNGVGFGAKLNSEQNFKGTGLKNIESQIKLLHRAVIKFSNYSDVLGHGAHVMISFDI
ncbi:histidine kinase [Alkalimonas collagenimarina]|uniref:Histidine kinase n=1 Tax=Alkalimonas collagenimarina TaxID=400390 RepID=A0ABT9GVN5_9GAMM|nr:histidine kinase [Alkalimonas collagenimarina]MDP4535113.1 histidine kinase [Alkalimonas collagenimarina]